MELVTKQGFKQTELGLIPMDWNVISLDEITKKGALIRGPFGGALKKEFFVKEGYKVYEQKNAIYQSVELGSYYINESKFKELKRFEVKEGDFILSCSGTIGKIYRIPINFKQGIINQALLIIRLDYGITIPSYFYHQFINESFQNKVIDDTQGGAMKNLIGMSDFRKASIPIPPTLKEQQAIATALSDVDDLIASLESLIAKKQAIKQGAMQQLLTPPHKGGKRLPGFSGEWVEKKLGEVTSIKTGSRNNQDKVSDGQYPFFVRSQTVEKINSYSYDCEAILVPGEGGIGSIFHYIIGKFEVHQRVYKISDFSENVSGKYIYLQMQHSFGKHAMTNSVKATVDSLRLPTFEEFILPLPPSKEEQKAITEILSDMDAEIKQLETKKAKYQQLKQGMMQELLTGKTRLV